MRVSTLFVVGCVIVGCLIGQILLMSTDIERWIGP